MQPADVHPTGLGPPPEVLATLPGGWSLLQACREPERAQRALLDRIVARNRHTAFARSHGLRPGMSPQDYRQAVPPRH